MPEWSRFVTLVKQAEELDKVSYHKLFDILKQYQNKVNEIRAEKIAKTANLLALVATTQHHPDTYYQALKSHKLYASPAKTSSLNRSHATIKNKGQEVAKPITPPSESESKEDSDQKQAQRDKDMETVGNQVVQESGIQCFNCKEFRHFAKECRKPKWEKVYTCHKEKMLLCKQAYKGVPLCSKQSDWIDDTDEELDEQELEALYNFMTKIQEAIPTKSGPTFDAEPLEQVDQNAKECDDEHVVLANLVANLKLDTDENKKIQKQLKKANTLLSHELKSASLH
nr:Gag-Pol polyprotein [Tanacetum cinerariifolium]